MTEEDQEKHVSQREIPTEEVLRLVIEEVDQARDILQLVEQLAPHLPIESFDELARSVGQQRMRFRDTEFDVESLREFIPSIVFPVQNLPGLVERVGHLVRLVPPLLGVDTASQAGGQRLLRYSGDIAPGVGLKSQQMITATAAPVVAGPPSPPQAS